MTQNHSHYLDYLDLRSDGRIVIYRRADHQNPKWTVRLKIPRAKGFVVKSTKTQDDFEARRFAEDFMAALFCTAITTANGHNASLTDPEFRISIDPLRCEDRGDLTFGKRR